ncbi:dienelactone hydrolase family protein [uncultured Desulfosarcina sp.]|uniref:dienelactone hydrolase family protein n=1 Tax=uncultured Desulfosarcina sp. TaxID=218289 RepID=UPI0029C6ABA7|nr:dienelactone hydrolase family protein [uncultured Desulfosarcina sp.]
MKTTLFKLLAIAAMVTILTACNATTMKNTKVELQSKSPYDYCHILDSEPDPAATINGVLTFPNDDETKKVPALVYVHGSGGKSSKNDQWLDMFRELGYATLQLDCFKGRNIKSSVGDHIQVTSEMMIADAYYALKYLAENPRIDANNIGIMGNSKGGITATYSAWDKVQEKLGEGHKFKFHIALYPLCFSKHPKDMNFVSKVLILSGEKDNYTPAAPCIDLGTSQQMVTTIVYPNAYHAFDDSSAVHTSSKAYNLTECKLYLREDGHTFELNSGYTLSDPEEKKKALKSCVQGGAKLGNNAAALKKAKEDIVIFLSSLR